MQIVLIITIAFIIAFGSGCASPHPNKDKAVQLLSEIGETAQKSSKRLRSEEIRQTMVRLNERKKKFPEGRNELMQDAKLVKDSFALSIEEDNLVIGKFEELMKLGLVKSEAQCIENMVELQRTVVERTKLVLEEMDLVFDQDIANSEVLESRTLEIRAKGKEVENKTFQLETAKATLCSKAILDIK